MTDRPPLHDAVRIAFARIQSGQSDIALVGGPFSAAIPNLRYAAPDREDRLEFREIHMAAIHDKFGRPVVVVTESGLVTSLGAGKTYNLEAAHRRRLRGRAFSRHGEDCAGAGQSPPLRRAGASTVRPLQVDSTTPCRR
jgi:hypothetical protein